MESFVVLALKRGKARLVRFSLELKGEVELPLEELDLAVALKQWKPDLLTIGEAENLVERVVEQSSRFGEETVLLVAPMPRAQEPSFAGSVALTVPSSMDPLRPKELLTTMLRSLLVSPLTKLLAGWALEAEVERRLNRRVPSAFLYADMDNFKAYNDSYGFAQGDRAIKLLAAQVVAAANAKATPAHTCAHIGGDDFAIITSPECAEPLGEELVRLFDLQVRSLYAEEDWKRGYILVEDRRGQVTKYPVMTLSVVSTSTEDREIGSYLELSSILSELKAFAKSISRSIYVRDRRKRPGERRGPSSPHI